MTTFVNNRSTIDALDHAFEPHADGDNVLLVADRLLHHQLHVETSSSLAKELNCVMAQYTPRPCITHQHKGAITTVVLSTLYLFNYAMPKVKRNKSTVGCGAKG